MVYYMALMTLKSTVDSSLQDSAFHFKLIKIPWMSTMLLSTPFTPVVSSILAIDISIST